MTDYKYRWKEFRGIDGYAVSGEEAERRAEKLDSEDKAWKRKIRSQTTTAPIRLEPPSPIPKNEKARRVLSPRADSERPDSDF